MKKPVHNQKSLKGNRKNLRNNGTSAEAELWTYLKNKQLQGRKFRRQQSIEKFIVDFYCPGEKLIIELDGDGHYEPGGEAYDEYRDEHLKTFGFTVLRFENELIFVDIENVLKEIVQHFGSK